MRPIVIYAPYLLVPLMLTLLFRKKKIDQTSWTYPITALLLFFYPAAITTLFEPGYTPRLGFITENLEVAYIVFSSLILLPASMILQLAFNRIFLIGKKEMRKRKGKKI